MTYKRWTAKQDEQLATFWGVIPLDELAKELGHTVTAVHRRACDRHLGSAARGSTSLDAFVRTTGYARSRILNAAKRLKLRILRRPQTTPLKIRRPDWRPYVVTEAQQERILEYLAKIPDAERVTVSRKGEWGTGGKPRVCAECRTKKHPHVGRGLCSLCYDRARRPARGRQPRLPLGVWGVGWRPSYCLGCQRSGEPHHCRGLCRRCYRDPSVPRPSIPKRSAEPAQGRLFHGQKSVDSAAMPRTSGPSAPNPATKSAGKYSGKTPHRAALAKTGSGRKAAA